MADKKISELDQTLLLDNDADFPLSQDNAGEPTTFRAKLTQLATKIAEDMTFSNLQTTSKKLVGAINELLSLGNPIILGTSAPTSSVGANGNIYVQYTAGTGGADDEVDGIFVKINGAWCEISTGGGSGTTDYDDLSNKPQVNSVELVGNKSLDDLGIMPASLSKTASGSLVHIEDGAENIPVKSLVSQIVAVESGSGEKSPDNPYTISGFDSGVVSVCGANLYDQTQDTISSYLDGNGVVQSNSNWHISDYIEIDNTNVIYNGNATAGRYGAYYDNSKTYISSFAMANGLVVLTPPNNAVYVRFSLFRTDLDNFKAYNGNKYTFTFGQTVYGGHFDNKGNLVVTHGYIEITGSENLYLDTAPNVVALSGIPIPISQVDTSLLEPMSNYATYSTQGTGNFNNNEFGLRTSGIVYYKNTSCTTLNDFRTLFANHHLQIRYKLANPITLSITSQDIPTLLGVNNFFSNTGDVEVNYYTDNADEIVEVAKATASTPLHNYSTDEQVVGTWIDGSTVYEKTVYISSLPNSTTAEYATGLSNIIPISFDNTLIFQSGNTSKAPYTNSGGTTRIAVQFNADGKIYFSTNTDQSTTSAYVTLRYTKTST